MTSISWNTMPMPDLRTRATTAPLPRLLRSELRWVFRRPRTLIALGLLGLVPIVIAIGVRLAAPTVDPSGLLGPLVSNGLALPIVSLLLTLALLLPLVASMSAADAVSGEASYGTLRGLLLAPVGRVRLFWVKAFGVLAVTFSAAAIIAVVGVISGLIALGSHGMLTLSGTTLGLGAAVGRVAIALAWVTVQAFAVAAIALAISTFTEHPLVVMAVALAGVIVFNVLEQISSLSWLQPYLITHSWPAVADLLRDPVPTTSLWEGLGRAGCYIAIGLGVAAAKLSVKDG